MARADEEIKKDVVDQLYGDNQVDASGIEVVNVENQLLDCFGPH